MASQSAGKCVRTILGFLLAAGFSSVLTGQENAGTIPGTVTDTSGAAVPEAKVTISGPTLPRGMETSSDAQGLYQFIRIPIGTYAMTVTKSGFTTLRQQGLQVNLGSQVSFNPKLEAGQVRTGCRSTGLRHFH
jgi:hypothetical protein